ncbi:MAG: hypothetical protein JXQ90_23390 [Cyclobacteriaceae bacterium]
MKTALLTSGELGLTTLRHLLTSGLIDAIATDKNSEEIITESKSQGLPVFIGNPRQNTFDQFLKSNGIESILSVNYIFIIGDQTLRNVKEAINIHGSLLPKYRGRTPHVWSIINGEQFYGITAHRIVPEVDAGDIVLQNKYNLTDLLTGGDILNHFQQIYPDIAYKIAHDLKNAVSFKVTEQNHSKATYFGKRTAADGRIDWNWSRNRIRNWIRAQAAPYPGAFFYAKSNKFIVNKSVLTDDGFTFDQVNGTVLRIDNTDLMIKVCDGTLLLSEIKGDLSQIQVGHILK